MQRTTQYVHSACTCMHIHCHWRAVVTPTAQYWESNKIFMAFNGSRYLNLLGITSYITVLKTSSTSLQNYLVCFVILAKGDLASEALFRCPRLSDVLSQMCEYLYSPGMQILNGAPDGYGRIPFDIVSWTKPVINLHYAINLIEEQLTCYPIYVVGGFPVSLLLSERSFWILSDMLKARRRHVASSFLQPLCEDTDGTI